ncbi:MAG TPA: LemA family protein [Puia sp.]|nr:LemA family protein [Puia sp.]
MKQINKVWLFVIAILVIVAIYTGTTYNRLVKQDENVKLTWGNLQNAYQRRLDLTPNLVSAVKGSSDFEKQTLQQVAEARSKALQVSVTATGVSAENYKKQEQAQAEVANSVNRVIGVIEKYPDLKTTKNFLYLQSQLEGTERRIKVSRNDFNGAVASYNMLERRFPSSVVAGLFGFKPKEGFTSEPGAETAPEVKF